MKRCTKCLLPDTYPGVDFDNEGVCAYCRSFIKPELLGEQAFAQKIESKRGIDYDCVIGISGGKDSSYVAYLAKKKFGLRVLLVSYDFPFMVELARRNIRSISEKLECDLEVVRSPNDIEIPILRNHLISLAATGTTWGQCLFCHYGIEAVLDAEARRRGIPFILKGTTRQEKWWDPGNRTKLLLKRVKNISLREKAGFLFYQSKAYRRLIDHRRQFPLPGNSCFTVYTRAKAPDNGPETIEVFDYIPWDQHVIERTLKEEVGWQRPPKNLSWRYDCILEPLLDFTYKKEFGISSAGLYLCGLIRSGLIARQEALGLLEEIENQERLDVQMGLVLDFLDIPPSARGKFVSKRP